MASYSGFWEGTGDFTPYALKVNRSPLDRRVGRTLKRRASTRLREVIDTVIAAASINGAAAVTYKRVQARTDAAGQPTVGGGAVVIETVTKIAASQSTTAADAARVDKLADFVNKPSTYPTDRSGNGGGGRLSATNSPG